MLTAKTDIRAQRRNLDLRQQPTFSHRPHNAGQTPESNLVRRGNPIAMVDLKQNPPLARAEQIVATIMGGASNGVLLCFASVEIGRIG